MNVGKAIFKAIADFSQVRRESKKTGDAVDRMNNSFKRTRGVASVLTGAVGAFGRFTGKLGAALPLLGSLAALLISGAGAALGLVAALAPLAGLAVFAPGFLLGGAAAMLAFGLAMKDAKTELAELVPLLNNVQKSASKGFWTEARQPIIEMAKELLPQVADGMGKVGAALGRGASDFSAALRTYLGGGVLKKMFDLTAEGADNARGAMAPIAEALTTIGFTGAMWLPRLGTWFTNLATRFNDFIQIASSNGDLQRWAENGLRVLRELGDMIGAVFNIFGALMKAAENSAPGNSLTILVDALQRFAAVLATPEVQSGLTNLFAGAHAAMDPIQAGLSAIGKTLGVLGPALFSVMSVGGAVFGKVLEFIAAIFAQPAVGSGIITFMDGLMKAVTALEPALGPLGDLIGAILPAAGAFATVFGQILGPALAIIAPLLTDIFKTLTPIAPAIVAIAAATALWVAIMNLSWIGLIVIAIVALVAAISFLVQHWDEVVAWIGQIWGGFVNWVIQITDGLVAWWNQVWGGFGNWVKEVWDGFVNWIKQIWDGFVSWIMSGVAIFVAVWNAYWSIVGQILTDIWNNIVSVVTTVWNGIVSFFTGIWNAIMAGVNWLVSIFVAAWTGLVSFLQPVIDVFAAMFGALGAVFNFIGALIGFVVRGIVMLFQMWWSATVTVFTNIWNFLVSVWTNVMNFISGVLNAIGAFFSAAWNWYWTTIFSILTTIWDFIVSVWTAVSDFISGVLNAIGGFVSSVWNSILAWITSVLNSIWSVVSSVWNNVMGFISGVLNSIWGFVSGVWNQIWGFLSGIMNSIWSTISGAWNNVVSFIQEAVGRAYSAVVDKFNEVVGWLGGIGGRILGAIGDLGGLLWNAGRSILEGLLGGLKDMWGGVQGFFNDLTASIPSWKGPLPVDKKLLQPAGKGIMGGFLGALESMYGKVRKSLRGFTGSLEGEGPDITPTFGPGGPFDPGMLLVDPTLGQRPIDVNSTTNVRDQLNTTPTSITYDVRELNVNNPKPETASESLPKTVRKLGYIGVGSNG
ncbi:tail length tape measure protein [Arthrobacter phage KellEzio]|uniref:Tape measure protein n=1 Tax=Arthrobacter phage KellEzio TaxID=1796995 RepID=A0A140G6B8_9CAUD|nr:tail length tape measure protein [Arthrobacter phage KellEzio]AMM44203.1 tape measure protein [Arthrobacter phage KellEzio]